MEEQIIERIVVETHSEPNVTTTVEKTEVFRQEAHQQQPNNGNYPLIFASFSFKSNEINQECQF